MHSRCTECTQNACTQDTRTQGQHLSTATSTSKRSAISLKQLMKMSLRYWNSVGERATFQHYIFLSELLLLQELDEDSSSSDSSIDRSSLEDINDDDDSTVITLDSLASFMLTDDSDEDEDEDGDVDMVGRAIKATIDYANHIYTPVVDETIDFDAPPLRIADLDESKALADFRFRKTELQEIADRLWPKMGLLLDGDRDKIYCQNEYTCPYETGLLLVLFRLCRPRRIRPDTESYFHMRKSKISAIILTFMDALYDLGFPYLSNASIFQHRFAFYADLIHKKCNLGGVCVWGFIDGTLRRTCRPSRFQKLAYSGHKRCHGIKFQSVTTPDGLIALMYGPINGNRHDSYMLAESGLLQQLRDLFPPGSVRYSLYGDPAYPQSALLFGGFRGAQPGSVEAEWNTRMSSVREAVEWLFGQIIRYWSFLDFRASMKIFLFPVAKYFIVGTFLTNLHSCCYGSQTSAYFDVNSHENGRLTMEEYIALVP